MMTRVVALAVVLLPLTACGDPSAVEPDARVVVQGSATRADGTPLTEGAVLVMKEIGPDEFAADMPLFLGTMGGACLAGVALDVCDESGTTSALAADGTFRVELTGRDVQSGFATTSTLWATVAAPSAEGVAGPSTSASFQARSENVQLPSLPLWDPAVRVTDRGRVLSVHWQRLPRRLGRSTRERASVQTRDGVGLWSLRQGEELDARVLEDARATVVVEARVQPSGDEGARVYRSQHHAVDGPGPAPSRGASCSAVATRREPVSYAPCPLTDGNLLESFDPALDPQCPKGKKCPHHDTAVVLDLGEVRDAALIVIRGDEDRLVVDGAAAPGRWRRIGVATTRQGRAALAVPRGTRVRYVRIAAARWPLPGLTEVSVW